jgi:hypothetical protein
MEGAVLGSYRGESRCIIGPAGLQLTVTGALLDIKRPTKQMPG